MNNIKIYPYAVDIEMDIPEETSSMEELCKFEIARTLAYLRELKKERKLCGKLGHTIIARYQLKGNVDEVINGLQSYMHDLMLNGMNESHRVLLNIYHERTKDFLKATWYKIPLVLEHMDALVQFYNCDDDTFERIQVYKQVEHKLNNFIESMHHNKQCLCHCNK